MKERYLLIRMVTPLNAPQIFFSYFVLIILKFTLVKLR